MVQGKAPSLRTEFSCPLVMPPSLDCGPLQQIAVELTAWVLLKAVCLDSRKCSW